MTLNTLKELEIYRQNVETGRTQAGCPDHTIRVCQAIAARELGYKCRADWSCKFKRIGDGTWLSKWYATKEKAKLFAQKRGWEVTDLTTV